MNERTTVRSKKPPTSANTSAQSHLLRRRCACGGTPGLDGECAGCRKERLSRRHRGQTDHDGPSTVPPIVNEVLRSPGQPLDADTRASMESRFGHDFGRVRVYNSLPRTVPFNLTVGPTNDVHEREADAAASRVAAATAMPGKRFADFGGVRVHTDSRAAESARALDARAYTLGHHIVFDEGRYASRTNEGRGLLAHELTHVLQQTGPATGILQRNPDDKEKLEEKPAAKFAGCDADQQGKIGEAIKQAGRRRMLAVHFLHVDHFKQINDTYGHTVGDTVLAKVARRLDDCVREGDTVARFSEEQNGDRVARLHGDEFMVIQYMVAHRSEAERLKQRLVECLSEPITVGGRALRVTVSSGFGLAPREAETVEDLKRIADAAMYREKAAKRQHGGMGAAA